MVHPQDSIAWRKRELIENQNCLGKIDRDNRKVISCVFDDREKIEKKSTRKFQRDNRKSELLRENWMQNRKDNGQWSPSIHASWSWKMRF